MSRKRQNLFEDMMEIASKLPWQVGCVLALISYFVIHLVAVSKAGTITGPGQMGNFVVKQMVITLSMFIQYILPAAFLVGALVSFINSKKREKLLSGTAIDKMPHEVCNVCAVINLHQQ